MLVTMGRLMPVNTATVSKTASTPKMATIMPFIGVVPGIVFMSFLLIHRRGK
jgi:hypothetical protein